MKVYPIITGKQCQTLLRLLDHELCNLEDDSTSDSVTKKEIKALEKEITYIAGLIEILDAAYTEACDAELEKEQ